MSQNVGVKTEPLKWPIAPDGFIPNSVIRSLLGKGKEETKEKEDEKRQDKEGKKKVEGNKRADEKKEKEEDEMDRIVLVKQSYDIQTKSTSLNHLKTFDDEKMNMEPQSQEKTNGVKRKTKEKEDEKNEKENEEDEMDRDSLDHEDNSKTEKMSVEPRRQEVSSTYSSRKTVNFTPASSYENEPKQLRELREDMKLHETITPPLKYLSVHNEQRTSSFIPEEPRMTSYIPPIELKNLTPHPLKPPPPTPEDPQPDRGPPECLPIRDKRSLLLLTKYSNIIDQAQMPLDRKVLELFKKIKASNKNSSHPRKLSATAERPPASKATHSTVQTNTGGPECPSHSPCSDYPAQFVQTILPIKGERGQKAMSEWRKSLYKHNSLDGFCSPRAARLATTDHLVKSSNARQLAATIPSLQPGQAAVHQRVLQKFHMKDTLEPASFHFHYVIPMASRHNFFTLNCCGKTQYGRLQFDWVRGSEEDKMLKVSGVKVKDPAVTKL